MDATLIVIDSDAELERARALVDRLMASDKPADIARLAAQARLIAAYEQSKCPRQPPRVAEVIRYLMDQHGLTRADMIPILGTASRVSEVLRGKKNLSMTMVQRLRTRFGSDGAIRTSILPTGDLGSPFSAFFHVAPPSRVT